MQQHIFERFVSRAMGTEELDVLWDAALEFAREEGFVRLGYVHFDSAHPELTGVLFAEGFDPDWVSDYVGRKLYLVDPVIEFAMHSTSPFVWDEVDRIARLTPEQTDLLRKIRGENDLHGHGPGDGLAVQVFGPTGRNGFVALGFDGAVIDAAPQHIRLIQAVCQAAHLRSCDLIDHKEQAPALSPREREVLGWIARGKSNAVIADILGVSAHTVDTHVRRIFGKLGATDRITAAIRGVGAGLVTV